MTKSDVLAPNNSEYVPDDQEEGGDEKKAHFIEEGFDYFYMAEECLKKKPIMHFEARCNEVNRNYEAENNPDYDNGVENKNNHSIDGKPKVEDKGKSGKKKKKGKDEVKDEEEEVEVELPNDPDNPEFDEKFRPINQYIYEVRKLGYDASSNKDYLKEQLEQNQNNYATAAYYLVQKDQDLVA